MPLQHLEAHPCNGSDTKSHYYPPRPPVMSWPSECSRASTPTVTPMVTPMAAGALARPPPTPTPTPTPTLSAPHAPAISSTTNFAIHTSSSSFSSPSVPLKCLRETCPHPSTLEDLLDGRSWSTSRSTWLSLSSSPTFRLCGHVQRWQSQKTAQRHRNRPCLVLNLSPGLIPSAPPQIIDPLAFSTWTDSVLQLCLFAGSDPAPADPPLLQHDNMATVKHSLPQRPPHQSQSTYSAQYQTSLNSTQPASPTPRTTPFPNFRDQSLVRQQYAHPLSRSNDSIAMLVQSDGKAGMRHSDHFLRRKTPNGVLNAAYDGTSVEQTERPHAMKHIILPVSDHFPTAALRNVGVGQDLPIVPSIPFDARSPYNTPQLRSPMPTDVWGNTLPMTPEHASTPWSGRPTATLDSVLNQLPIQTAQQLMYPANGLLHGFMPPPLQPPFVPTASGSYQTFGPFWPYPGYQNYFPAATRDVFWNPIPSDFHPNSGQIASYSGWQIGAPRPGTNPNFASPIFTNPNHSLPPNQPFSTTQNFNPLFQNQAQTPNFAYAPTMQTPHLVPNLSNPTPNLGFPIPLEFGINSENVRNRDRVFEQAVTTYQELVKHLGRTRAASSGNRSQALPIRYPRAPRQPGSDSPVQVQRHNSTGAIGSERPPLPSQHRHSFITGRDHSARDVRQNGPGTPSWQSESNTPLLRSPPTGNRFSHLRNGTDSISHSNQLISTQSHYPFQNAVASLDRLTVFCQESNWRWIEGLLLGGSLAYALADYPKAYDWYSKILKIDPKHVETITNLGATLMAMERKSEAQEYWRRAVQLRPGRFDAVEHLVGLYCTQSRNKDAIAVIDFVENALRRNRREGSQTSDAVEDLPPPSETDDRPVFDYETERDHKSEGSEYAGSDQPGFGSSGYAIPGTENGRMHTLVHARGNLLYGAGDIVGAARAFEEAVLITVGRHFGTIDGLVSHILTVLSREVGLTQNNRGAPEEPLLIPPSFALETLRLCFSPDGNLPGLRDLPANGNGLRSAMGTTSNSLLSLAKIFQDSMASSNPKPMPFRTNFGVREILALYYLSISLQKSPSTANNVGILLAGLQQQATPKMLAILAKENLPSIPGVVPGTGISMALAYYNFGLNLDRRHAHLYTNLGSLLKDLGQLNTAIKMYDEAVKCDPKFDIALANLANAVKDQGRIADAISYYKRAVDASPDFAEAVCGLANALNSVCGWKGRGGIAEDHGSRDRWHVDENGMLRDGTNPGAVSSGWIKRVVALVDKQLSGGELWGQGIVTNQLIDQIIASVFITIRDPKEAKDRTVALRKELHSWQGQKGEGHRAIRLVERTMRRLTWQWYQDSYVRPRTRSPGSYNRPLLPANLPVPAAPTVLPFHTFTSPMSAKQIRQISQRNGLRISCSTLKAPWLPVSVWRPPKPPNPYLKVGYVSSDFNNHPLAHLMQSVFGMHDRNRVKAYCYATTGSDNSIHRQQIEREAPRFYDASTWSAEKLVKQIVEDGVHILVNLNGYTRGARNEVFAARPAPIQMSFMGFAGTLGAEWCDYLLADETAVPPSTLRPWRRNVDVEDQLQDETVGGSLEGPDRDWIYGENLIYCRDTFFCCDHKQSAPDAQDGKIDWEQELTTRWTMRKEIFPQLPDDAIIIGNFNQLYKIEPTTFRTWLRILDRVPSAVLWLLRFPDLGETYLRKTALQWAGPDVANRVVFTDVAPKQLHISRARVLDLFVDTPECNAHTTSADILWSGTPLLTLPRYKYKMCSRMAASILKGALPKGPEGAQAAEDLIALTDQEYEDKAVKLLKSVKYFGHRPTGRLAELRKMLFTGRWQSALFDTKRWVRDLEEAYEIAWDRWVKGEGGDIWLEKKD